MAHRAVDVIAARGVTSNRDGFLEVAYSTHPIAANAVGEIAAELLERDRGRPDLLFVFVTRPFAGILEDIAPALRHLLSPTTLVGCAAEQLIGPDGWLIDGPGVIVMALNSGEVRTVRYDPGDLIEEQPDGIMVLLADPFTTNISLLANICGGYATAGDGIGGNRLVLDDQIFTDGAVGVILPAETTHPYADDFLVEGIIWNSCRAILTFTELDVEVLNQKAAFSDAGGLAAPGPDCSERSECDIGPERGMVGFVSKRSFPISLVAFTDGEENS